MKQLFLLLVTILSSVVCHADEQAYFDLMGEADKAIADGDWATAESKLLEALHSEPANPSNVLLMSNLGIVRFNMGQDSLALETLNHAVAMAPASVTIRENRARVLTGMGDLEGARADYERLIEMDSTLLTPHFYRGVLALTANDTVTARTDFEQLVRLDPESFEANFGMASLACHTGHYAESLPYLNAVIRLDPQPEYYAQRAFSRLQTDDLGGASEDIQAGLELDPMDGELYLYRAALNKMRFRPDDSLKDAERALQLGVHPARVAATLK